MPPSWQAGPEKRVTWRRHWLTAEWAATDLPPIFVVFDRSAGINRCPRCRLPLRFVYSLPPAAASRPRPKNYSGFGVHWDAPQSLPGAGDGTSAVAALQSVPRLRVSTAGLQRAALIPQGGGARGDGMVQGSLAALAQAVRRAAPRPRKAALELTDAAVARVKELLSKRNKVWELVVSCIQDISACQESCGSASRSHRWLSPPWWQEFLKLGVKTRGCNGMAYTLNYADNKVGAALEDSPLVSEPHSFTRFTPSLPLPLPAGPL